MEGPTPTAAPQRRRPDSSLAEFVKVRRFSMSEPVIRPTGFFRVKARSLREAARIVVAEHGGEVPQNLDDLVALLDPRRLTVRGDFNVRGAFVRWWRPPTNVIWRGHEPS